MTDDKDSDLVKEFRKRRQDGRDAASEFHKSAKTHFAYYSNKQWEKADSDVLSDEDRPALTFNQVTPLINAVAGTEITNRFESRFFPRTLEDVNFADMLSELVRYVRQSTDAEHEESAAFMDCVITGVGCTEFYQDYSKKNSGAEGKTIIQRVPVFEVVVDPASRKSNYEDIEWLVRDKWISERKFISIYNQEKLDLVKASAADQEDKATPNVHDQTASNAYESDYKFYDRRLGLINISEYQRLEQEEFFVVEINGQPYGGDLTADELDKFMADNRIELDGNGEFIPDPTGQDGITSFNYEPVDRTVYKRSFIAGDIVLEDGDSPVDSFTYRFLTGFRREEEGKVTYFGLMEGMIDPQKWANKMLSQLVHIVATNPKGAILAEEGVFDNVQQARTDWGKPNPIIEMAPRALQEGKMQIVHGKYPDSIERVMEISMSSLSRVTGLGPYFTSQVEDLRRTAGSAVSSIQKQGLVVLSVLFDALKKYRKMAGELHLEFIDKFMPDGAVFRITNNPASQVKSVSFSREWIEGVKYDIIVDDAPTSTNALSELWNSLVQTDALGTLIERGILTMDIVADIMPNVPSEIRSRMKENYENQQLAMQQQAALPQASQQSPQTPQ